MYAQGARGGRAAEWFIENVFEELVNKCLSLAVVHLTFTRNQDAENEFFFHEKESKLYYYTNATEPQGIDQQIFHAVELQTLVNVSGTKSKPVTGITIRGITFTGAAPTYMEPHAVPSGGDW